MLLLVECSRHWTNSRTHMGVWKSFDWFLSLSHTCNFPSHFLVIFIDRWDSIHHKQTLALFCSILPFAMASDMDWWAVPLVAFVTFTLYGIEGIAQTYEDPFGVHKIDINMDDIVEDARREVEVMLTAWQTQGPSNKGIFRPRVADSSRLNTPRSEYEGADYFRDLTEVQDGIGSQVRFVVDDTSRSSSFRDDGRERFTDIRDDVAASASSTPTPRAPRSRVFET